MPPPRLGLVAAGQVDRLAALYPATSPTAAARRLPSFDHLTPAQRATCRAAGIASDTTRLYLVSTGLCWRLVWATSRSQSRQVVVGLSAATIHPKSRLATRGDLANVVQARKLLSA